MIGFFVDRPMLSGVLAFVLVIAGSVSAFLLPISRFPDVAPPVVQITTTFTGGSAQAVEENVTTPLEQAINGVDGLIYLTSTSSNAGVSSISATFEVGYDIDVAAIDVLNRVNRARPSLPASVRDVGVTIAKASPQLTAVVALYSPEGAYDELFLSNYAEINLLGPMNRVPGIGSVTNFTEKVYAIRVWLDPDRMAYHGLSPADVTEAIRLRNAPRAAGAIGSAPAPAGQAFSLSVSAPQRAATAEEFEALLVGTSAETGAAIRLGELGRVEFGSQSYGSESWYSGRPSAQIGIFQAPGANAIEVVGNIRAELDRQAERFPPGMEYEIAFSTATFVQKSIQNVVITLCITVALVVATVYLFLQTFRATLLPVIVIPVALIGSLSVLYLLGFSINTLSLLGMILAVGLVVDDAIVVVENVTRNLQERDADPGDAVKRAMAEVTGPILATTLVLLGLFVPVAFTPGLTGNLYNQFALTIAATVSLSSLTALTLTPALSRVILRRREREPARPFQLFNRAFESGSERYRRGIERLERVWWAVLIGFALLLALVVFLFLERPTGFVPTEDQGNLIVDVQLPPGASLERSAAVIRELEARFLEEPGVDESVAIAGSSLIGDASASYTGFLILRLAPWGERDVTAAELTERLQGSLAAYPHARVQVINPPSLPGIGAGGGLSFEIQALDNQPIDDLAGIAQRVVGQLNAAPELAAAFSSFNADVPQLELDVDIEKAEQLGVTSAALYDTLQTYLGSAFVSEFARFGRNYRVYVQAEAEARDESEDIARLAVRNARGEMVPMAEMVDVRFATGPEAISHFNLYRSVGVIAQAAPGVSGGEATSAIERVLDEALPSDYGYGWTGAVYQQNKAGNLTPLIFGLAILFAFLTLTAQYESLVLPGAILFAAPFAMLGALGLLALLDMPIDVFAQIGLLMLVGLSAKNAILIVSFAENARRAGASPAEAAARAAALRLRPVLMTALSFILGAMPLAFATGAGANAQASVGITVIGGMIAATVLTLLVTPVLYMLAARFRAYRVRHREAA
jgi:HAE1 family hydrophobic/amphiphilic exporter-1